LMSEKLTKLSLFPVILSVKTVWHVL